MKKELRVDYLIERGIEYGVHDGVKLPGDLYLPTSPGPHPIVVAIHGGGWQIGERERYEYWGPYLATRGYALFTIDYRLSAPGKKTFPEAVHDVRAAVQFMRSNAAKFKLDPERVALIGDSAGGHLAALVALAGDAPIFANGYPNDPYAKLSTQAKCVVSMYGVHDMLGQWEHDCIHRVSDHITEKFLGTTPLDDPRLFFDASPMAYVSRARSKTAFLLAHGTEDDIVDRATQWDRFLINLKRAGFYARAVVVQGAGHFWASEPHDEPGSAAAFLAPRMVRFFQAKL